MTILQQIENLKSELNSVRSNSDYSRIEGKILKLAKVYNKNNYFDRFIIFGDKIYGMEKNPNYLND